MYTGVYSFLVCFPFKELSLILIFRNYKEKEREKKYNKKIRDITHSKQNLG